MGINTASISTSTIEKKKVVMKKPLIVFYCFIVAAIITFAGCMQHRHEDDQDVDDYDKEISEKN